MKTILFFCHLLAISALGQSTNRYRFEVEGGASSLRLPSPYQPGYHIRQQITGYFQPRLGIAFGIGWGVSANNDPLKTVDPAAPQNFQPDPAQLTSFYSRQDHMMDLSVAYLPILSQRHQLKLQAGLSLYRQREVGVDSIFRADPRFPDYRIIGKFTNTRQVVPIVALSYGLRLSPRWGIGLNGTAYFTTNRQSTITLGLLGSYRFGLSADSLGMKPIRWNSLRAGIRLGANVVGENGMRLGGHYRIRFIGGLWTELPLSLTWAVRGELNYAQRGYRLDEVDLGNARYLSAFANLNYLEMPLLFRHEVAYRWHLYTGPYLAFFLNGYSETSGVRNSAVRPHTSSGLMIGTSYDIAERLSADLRYQRDLIRIASTPYGGFHAFQITMGWAFR